MCYIPLILSVEFQDHRDVTCNKKHSPPGYDTKAKKCENLWREAEKILQGIGIGQEEFQRASAIKIEEERNNLVQETTLCYNPKLFVEKGWCQVDEFGVTDPLWGFCSPSCDVKYLLEVIKFVSLELHRS